MAQDKIKHRIQKLYTRYLSGEISKKEFNELFDLMYEESNQTKIGDIVDETLPSYLASIQSDEKGGDLVTVYGSEQISKGVSRWRRMYWISSAAAVLLLLTVFLFQITNRSDEWIVYTTGYQETLSVDLPDGSLVVLNANSELRYREGLEKIERRVVEFKGEGYFDVAHLEGRSFVVHTGSVDVNVLGTEFNLETRRDFTNVFLKTGKVILNSDRLQPIEMLPGDLVHYDEEKKEVRKVSDQSSAALSWKEGIFTFTDLTGIQILHKMEDIYGKEFIIEHPEELSDVIVVQGLPYTDWDFTREALELALDVQFMDSTANKIIVNKK